MQWRETLTWQRVSDDATDSGRIYTICKYIGEGREGADWNRGVDVRDYSCTSCCVFHIDGHKLQNIGLSQKDHPPSPPPKLTGRIHFVSKGVPSRQYLTAKFEFRALVYSFVGWGNTVLDEHFDWPGKTCIFRDRVRYRLVLYSPPCMHSKQYFVQSLGFF